MIDKNYLIRFHYLVFYGYGLTYNFSFKLIGKSHKSGTQEH